MTVLGRGVFSYERDTPAPAPEAGPSGDLSDSRRGVGDGPPEDASYRGTSLMRNAGAASSCGELGAARVGAALQGYMAMKFTTRILQYH